MYSIDVESKVDTRSVVRAVAACGMSDVINFILDIDERIGANDFTEDLVRCLLWRIMDYKLEVGQEFNIKDYEPR